MLSPAVYGGALETAAGMLVVDGPLLCETGEDDVALSSATNQFYKACAGKTSCLPFVPGELI